MMDRGRTQWAVYATLADDGIRGVSLLQDRPGSSLDHTLSRETRSRLCAVDDSESRCRLCGLSVESTPHSPVRP